MNLDKVCLKDKPELSVVVLGYRAGSKLKDFISDLTSQIEKKGIDYQIVLVGNYWPDSDDTTPQAVAELAQANLRIKPVIWPKKGAMGWDMKSGLAVSDGKLIAVIDGDGQMPACDVVRVYQKIKEGNLDFVKTFRRKRSDGLWRRMISFLYNLIFKILFPGLKIKDINSKPKIFTREFLDQLKLISDDWFIDAEIMIQARRHKVRMGEISTVFNQNNERASFVKIPAVFEFSKNLIKARIYESFNHWRQR